MAGSIEREISIVLKVQNLDVVRKQLKDLIPKELGQVASQVEVVTNNVTNNLIKMGGAARTSKTQTEGLADGFSKLYKSMLPVATFYGIKALLSKGMGFAELGSDLERAKDSFTGFIGNADMMLPAFRRATRGAVDDLHLLKTANRAFVEGIKSDQLTDVFKIATAASRKLGLSVEETIQTVSNAISRHDESALTTLGVITKTNKAYAIQMGLIQKVPGVVQGAMRIQMQHAFIMNSLNQYTKGFNNLTADGRENLDRFKASFDNLRASFGTTLTNVFGPMAGMLGSLFDTINSGLQIINKYPQALKAMANILGTLASAYIAVKAAALGYAAAQWLIQKSSPVVYMIGLAAQVLRTQGAFSLLRIAASLAWTAITGPLGIAALIGATLFSVGGGFEGLSNILGRVATGARVIFSLLSTLDEESGVSKVLKKDKEELGGWFNVAVGIAQGFYLAKTAVQAFGTGVVAGLGAVMRGLGILEDFEGIVRNIFSSDGPLQTDSIDKMSRAFEKWGEMLGNIIGALNIMSLVVLKVAGALGYILSKKQEITASPGGFTGPNVGMDDYISATQPTSAGFRQNKAAPDPLQTSGYAQQTALPPQNQITTTSDSTAETNRAMLIELKKLNESNDMMRSMEQEAQLKAAVNSALTPNFGPSAVLKK